MITKIMKKGIMNKSMGKAKFYFFKIRNFSLFLIVGSILGLLALIVVYCIPSDKMKSHVQQSIPMIQRDFQYSDVIEGYPASCVGSFTDCLMLEHSVYSSEEHTLLEQVMYMYRGESSEGEGWAPGYSLIDYLSGAEQVREVEYSRYWHGYLVILKPLLYLMSFNAIRVLASCIQLFLLSLVLIMCFQRNEKLLGIGFVAAMPFLYFSNLYMSLSLSICFYLLAVSVMIQLKWNEKICRLQWYGEFFFIIGMAVAYFDFLTYPLVTLGFPLCICLYLNGYNLKNGLKKIGGYSACWFGGYIGLWAMKWVLTDILVEGSTIKDSIDTILQRTDHASDQSRLSGFISVVFNNLDAYTNWAFYLVILAILVGVVLLFTSKRNNLRKENIGCAVSILIVAVYPFVWFFFVQNHSEEHWLFTCKILSISIFAFICAVGKMVKNME